jgi:hypothetical protein
MSFDYLLVIYDCSRDLGNSTKNYGCRFRNSMKKICSWDFGNSFNLVMFWYCGKH